LSAAGLEARLQRVLDERYHHLHPFNVRMHEGALTRDELRTWVRNRYYYQTRIPLKDSLILGKSEEPSFRRGWVRRIHDHDGDDARLGGLELWLALAEAVGLVREEVASLRDVLPGVRRACDAYVEFVASGDLLTAVASSLTELRAGALMARRIEAWERHYPWVAKEGLDYFRSRTRQAPRDAREGLAFVLERAESAEDADRCVAALARKCEILWQLLDGVEWGGTRFALAAGVALRDDRDGWLAVGPERAVQVNETGRAILSLCDGTRSACDVAHALRAAHPDGENVERAAYDFLEEMERLRVLGPTR
jgi:pyrroloquinoline-quinone synthase